MKKQYVVTTDAREVAGMRSPGNGKTVMLTERQAEHPLRIGTIAEPVLKAPEKKRSRK